VRICRSPGMVSFERGPSGGSVDGIMVLKLMVRAG